MFFGACGSSYFVENILVKGLKIQSSMSISWMENMNYLYVIFVGLQI